MYHCQGKNSNSISSAIFYITTLWIITSVCAFADWLITNPFFIEPQFCVDFVPAPEIKEICRLHNKIYKGYDCFDRWTTTIYSGTAIDSGMKDRFIYHNRYLTIKILNQTAFFEKCACLLSAIYLNIWHHLNFYDIHFKSNIFSKLW